MSLPRTPLPTRPRPRAVVPPSIEAAVAPHHGSSIAYRIPPRRYEEASENRLEKLYPSQAVKLAYPAMFCVYSLDYDGWQTVYLPKFTVISLSLQHIWCPSGTPSTETGVYPASQRKWGKDSRDRTYEANGREVERRDLLGSLGYNANEVEALLAGADLETDLPLPSNDVQVDSDNGHSNRNTLLPLTVVAVMLLPRVLSRVSHSVELVDAV